MFILPEVFALCGVRQRLCLWTPPPFVKGGRKLLFLLEPSSIAAKPNSFGTFSESTRPESINFQFLDPFSLAKGVQVPENALSRIKCFARCDERPKALPLDTTTFCKRWTKTFVLARTKLYCGEAEQLWYFLRKYKAQPARI